LYVAVGQTAGKRHHPAPLAVQTQLLEYALTASIARAE